MKLCHHPAQASISNDEPENVHQRSMFGELNQLLSSKLMSKKKREGNQANIGFAASEYDMGSAKVMRLDMS